MKSSLLMGLLLLLTAQAAPIEDVEQEDPELSGGFFQGDIELDVTRNGIISEAMRWPNGIVHYKIDDVFDADHLMYIHRALQNIEQVSCIRFVPATDEMTAYLHIISEHTGCHSKVGYHGIVQTLNLQHDALDKGCFKLGTIMHETLHALGFHHQQCSSDRDQYIRIVEENIKDGKQGDFKKYGEDIVTNFGLEYDYGSILHYSATAFSKNGEKTIVPLRGENIEIGQRRALSQSDIAKLNIMYKCPVWLNGRE